MLCLTYQNLFLTCTILNTTGMTNLKTNLKKNISFILIQNMSFIMKTAFYYTDFRRG